MGCLLISKEGGVAFNENPIGKRIKKIKEFEKIAGNKLKNRSFLVIIKKKEEIIY